MAGIKKVFNTSSYKGERIKEGEFQDL